MPEIKIADDQVTEELWARHEDGREVFAHATLVRDAIMRCGDADRPALAGTRVLVTMFSRFGDVGIRDTKIDRLEHGYASRVPPEDLTDWIFVSDGGYGWRRAIREGTLPVPLSPSCNRHDRAYYGPLPCPYCQRGDDAGRVS